ncbi:AlpA family transcriptional regulator [Sphingopyxis sp. USTB-05]|uniref:helix-turn-helix transcriptional regulator n=1 Tax=Sphingopyxis sp. USTB-05 TaxID=2830667 RepID=UPI0020786D5A|nr:AlpA family phage regulatory protein [Sphingopyxis sp. USTB-05]USI78662.1 AlpA family phage regulatory protein [Sphingopyxis sp. USTB-05]
MSQPLQTTEDDQTATPETKAMLPERFLKLEEVSRRVGLGKTMIYAMIRDSRFPAPYKISPFAARWSEREVVAWIDDVKDGFEGKRRRV